MAISGVAQNFRYAVGSARWNNSISLHPSVEIDIHVTPIEPRKNRHGVRSANKHTAEVSEYGQLRQIGSVTDY
jgi:hypothetical protein